MKTFINNKGQSAAEFMLVFPFLCAALIGCIVFVIFCWRAELASYATFMTTRVYNVWPQDYKYSIARAELVGLLRDPSADIIVNGGVLEVTSTFRSPFRFNSYLNNLKFKTKTAVALEPSLTCVEDDNGIPNTKTEACL